MSDKDNEKARDREIREGNFSHKDNAEYTHERDEPNTPPPQDRDQSEDSE